MQKKYILIKNKLKMSRKNIVLLNAVILSFCILTFGMLVAKYLNEKSSEGTVRAQNFYFTSDFLDGKEHTLAPGSTSVTFTLGNHADDLRYSEMDIEYNVTVDKDGVEDNSVTIDNKNNTLQNSNIIDEKVTIKNLKSGTTYTIKAVGKGGYTKTLTAMIVVPTASAKLFYHIDNSVAEYTLLTVWNEGDAKGNVTITYTGIPDNTNPNMTDWKTSDTSKTVEISPHQSMVFRFFNATNVTVTNAEAKQP